MAVTDHDTIAGCGEAMAAGRELGLEVVPGIELSSRYGKTIHILGYFLRTDSPALTRVLEWIVAERNERNRKMVDKMAADGLNVDYEQMLERFGPVIGRPNFGQVLVELGWPPACRTPLTASSRRASATTCPGRCCPSSARWK